MKNISWFIVTSSYVWKNDLVDHVGKTGENRDFLQVKRNEISLIWCSIGLLTYFWDGHEFVLIVFIHEVNEPLFLGKPWRKVIVFILAEVDRFGKGESIVVSFQVHLLF